MLKYKITFLLLLLLLAATGKAQEGSSPTYLNVRGISELDMEPLSGATATLYEGTTQVHSVKTGSDGRFSFKLEVNKNYTIEISKEGLISKRISFNTTMPDNETGLWTNEFSIGLVRYCDGVDYSILNEPVDIVEFDARRREFVSNKEYVARMRPKIENVLMDYEACVLDKYDDAIRKADQLAAQKKYHEAISSYQAALEIYPDEKLPGKRIAELETWIEKEQENEAAYNQTIAAADALFEQQHYNEALAKYQEASAIKPQESYPKQQIKDAEEAYSAQQAEIQARRTAEDAYNQALAKAGLAYTQRDYKTAQEYYQKASEIKPSETLPDKRLEEIRDILTKKAAEEAKAKEINDAYNHAIAEAEVMVKNRQYDEAKEKYAFAQTIKPSEAYPKTKIAEIEQAEETEARAEENAKRAAAEQEYQSILAEADELFQAKDYDGAKAAYNRAVTVKPSESFPRQKIRVIENVVAAEQAAQFKVREDQYKIAMDAADFAILQKNYEQAKKSLDKALEYKPDDFHAQNKIAEVNFLIAEREKNMEILQLRDEQFNHAIAAADQYMDGKDYNEAQHQYQKAIQIKPGDPYANKMLKQIEDALLAEKTIRLQELEMVYSDAMTSGVEAFVKKNYAEAKDYFRRALEIKPEDVSATLKLSEVEQAVTDEENRLMAEREKKQSYDEVVAKADDLFGDQDYSDAKTVYEHALQIFPAELYPRQKIDEINEIFAEQHQLLQEKQALENAYQKVLVSADQYYMAKNYSSSRDAYIRALSIKPDESYPKTRLAEVEALIQVREQEKAEAAERGDKYALAMNTANALFDQKEYLEAKSSYNLALQYIPDDALATKQIDRIDRLLAASSWVSADGAKRQSASVMTAPLNEMEFSSDLEKNNYFDDLRKKYPEGITLEIYRDEYKETLRYIVIRNDDINEFRKIRFLTFGGEQYYVDGKPITRMYFNSQIRQRDGESYKETVMQ